MVFLFVLSVNVSLGLFDAELSLFLNVDVILGGVKFKFDHKTLKRLNFINNNNSKA